MILPGRRNRYLRLLAVVFFLFTAALSLYGRGARDDSILSTADELIANKEYDQAIQFLTNYIQTNPDRFGEAQMRLQKIVKIREQYNKICNELLDVLEKDPENNTRILELSDLLLTIESPSNPQTRLFLDQVRYLAEFNVNKARLNRILAEARAQLEQNNFTGALETYASGLDIYQKLYFSSGYGQEAEDVASRGLEGINRNIRDFGALINPFKLASQTVTGSSLPREGELSKAYAGLASVMDSFLNIRKDFFNIQKSFEDELVILQKEQNITGDMNFLSFAGRLIAGPSGQTEGMVGVLERFWSQQLTPLELALIAIINRSYDAGLASMQNMDFTAGIESLDNANQYITIVLELLDEWNRFLEMGVVKIYSVYDNNITEQLIANYLKFRTMGNSLIDLKNIGNIGNRGLVFDSSDTSALASWQAGKMDTQTAFSKEQDTRRSYQSIINELSKLGGQIDTETETLRTYTVNFAAIPGGPGTPYTYFSDARKLATDISDHFQNQEYQSAVRQYTVATGDIEKRTLAREAEFSEGNSLIQGVPRSQEGGATYTAFFPGEGLAIITRMNQSLTGDIGSARTLVGQYAGEPRYILDETEIQKLQTSSQDLLARLLALQGQSTAVIASARTQVDKANAQRLEGDRLFKAAQDYMNRSDFDNARISLGKAQDQYNSSLAIQESTSLRNTWNTDVVNLGTEIIRRQNEVVVKDVRNLVNSARDSYYNGNMEQAEEQLVRAQNRWRVTNVTEHTDVEYWLRLVRGAMSLQSGRTIAPTAPLYAEMSQLLSDAGRSYNDGIKLLSGGNPGDGRVKFAEALTKTKEVRLMFPMNRDARLLELKIEQQTDPAVFNASFRQRINDAVAGTKLKNTESFAELQDLAAINPQYPGIQTLLAQAEIDMGLRPPPPDPKALAQSTELTQSAQANINTRDTTRYQVALTQLTEAIRLNPNNTQAQALIDDLQIRMTGSGSIVMDSYTQSQYEAAQQAYLRGNYVTANAIVVRLLQDPKNQKSIQIQELKRRIEAVL